MSCKRAFDSSKFALLTNGEHYIKLDDAIRTMLETGKDLNHKYRETSLGGLAKTKLQQQFNNIAKVNSIWYNTITIHGLEYGFDRLYEVL